MARTRSYRRRTRATTRKRRRTRSTPRRTTKRKTTTTRKRAKPKMMLPKNLPTAMRDLTIKRHSAVALKPFALRNENPHPKIPDGKMDKSLGRRYKNVTTLSVAAGTTCEVYVFPSMGAIAMACGNIEKGIYKSSENQKNFTLGSFAPVFFANAEGSDVAAGLNTAQHVVYVRDISKVTKRRIVSQGVRLTLTNDDQTNDGWFEAWRFPVKRANDDELIFVSPEAFDKSQVDLISHEHTGGVALSYMDPVSTFAAEKRNRMNVQSYKTGLLRDIGKLEFNLKHTTHDREPVQSFQYDGVRAVANMDGLIDELRQDGPIPSQVKWYWMESSAGSFLQDQLFDYGMDCICILLHAGVSGSNFIFEGIQNIESEHATDSPLHHFQSENVKDPNIEMQIDNSGNNAETGEPQVGG